MNFLPHTNIGLLTFEQLKCLNEYNASMGLMLESTCKNLFKSGGVHENSPGKIPENRIEHIKNAGKLKIPFTTGLLLGIGESFEDRIKKYEERSNPVMRFIEDYCEEEAGKIIPLKNFTNECNEYLKTKHLRFLTAIQIGKILRGEGFSVGQRKINDVSCFMIFLFLHLIFVTPLLKIYERQLVHQ